MTVLLATRTFVHEWKKPSCLYSVSIHQMAPPLTEVADIPVLIAAYYSFIDTERMKG